MTNCAKGCGKPARIRGLCKGHYNTARKYRMNRQRWSRSQSVGVTRRIRALVAIGYSQRDIADLLVADQSWVSKLAHNERPNVNAMTVARVTELYDRISMTPGSCERSRERARRKGWAPPLAWDEDDIDNPEARPNTGAHETVRWDERYLEMRELGYSDIEIMRKLEIQPESMLRQLARYGLKPSADLVTLGTSIKHRRRVAS